MRRPSVALTILCLLALAVPTASAHNAPAQADADTRLLQDGLDDCSQAEQKLNDCKGSDDVQALDVRETADAAGTVTVVFRLYAEPGTRFPVEDRFTFNAPTGSKSLSWKSADGKTYTASGFDSVGAPTHYGDSVASRFYIEGRIALAKLGNVGQKLSGFHVDALAGGAVGDFMFAPSTASSCNNTVGSCAPQCPPGTSCPRDEKPYVTPDYSLRGAGYYVTFTVPSTTQQVGVGSETLVTLNVRNDLDATAQDVRIRITGAQGLTARFHDPSAASGTGYSAEGHVGLQGGGSSVMHLALQGETPTTNGKLQLTLTTDQGGRIVQEVPYSVVEATTVTESQAPSGESTSHASPGAPAAAGALGLLALAWCRRR